MGSLAAAQAGGRLLVRCGRRQPLLPPAARAFAAAQVLPPQSDGDGLGDGEFETLVGLELHVQVNSQSKLFSSAPTAVGVQPNSQVELFDVAIPGTLPRVNRACVEAAVRTGVALGGTINQRSTFDRKHYVYPDLPHGYQITQLREPIVSGGCLDVPVGGAVQAVSVQRIQLETDTGKSLHDVHPAATCIDLNRAGCALMEVVTGPDLRGGEEAAAFVKQFQQLLRHIGTSDGNMEDGSLRVDVNVSVRRRDGGGSSERVEVKNLNSTRSIARAVEHEAARHAEALGAGRRVDKETRGFDAKAGATFPLRSKAAALDYRFMPEPDIPPVVVTDAELAALRASVPELPDAVAARLQRVYGLQPAQAKHFTREAAQRALLDATMATGPGQQLEGRLVANMIQGDLLRATKEAKVPLGALPAALSPGRLAELLLLLKDGKLSRGLTKPVLAELVGGDERPLEEIAGGLSGGDGAVVADEGELRAMCEAILAKQQKEVAEYRNGNARKMMSFVGALMKETKGRADPKAATELFRQLIDASGG